MSTSYDYDEVISVVVGLEKAKFSAPRDVVCGRSRFFHKSCSLRWREGQEKVVPLPDCEPETFQMYMDTTYNRLVYDIDSSSLPLVKLHVLADYLVDVKARHRAMRLLLNQRRYPSPETADFLWENTSRGSLLRQWAVDAVAAKLGIDRFARLIGSYPAEFVQQIALKMYGHASAVIPYPSPGLRGYLEAEVRDED